jgi:hypothetical protein
VNGDDAPDFAEFASFVTRRHDPNSCNQHWQQMKSLLFPDAIAYTHVLKTETLARDLDVVLARIAPGQTSKTVLAAARTNESLPVAWKQQYDQRLADAVFDFYREDFEHYGYDRESWKPGAHDHAAAPAAEEIEKRALAAIRDRNEVIDVLYAQIEDLQEELKRIKSA